MQIKGVHGPLVKVCGIAEIPIEMDQGIFSKTCIVIEDSAIDFPANTDLILGANLFAHHEIDISLAKWALLQNGQILQHLEPAWMDGKLFTRAEADYIANTDCFNDAAREEENEAPNQLMTDSEPSATSRVSLEIVDKLPPSHNMPRFYPEESQVNENLEHFQYSEVPPPLYATEVPPPVPYFGLATQEPNEMFTQANTYINEQECAQNAGEDIFGSHMRQPPQVSDHIIPNHLTSTT